MTGLGTLLLLPLLAASTSPSGSTRADGGGAQTQGAGAAALPVLTLDEAIAQALAANPAIAASRETRTAADARVDQSWTGFLPQLLLSVGYRRATANSPAPPYLNTAGLPAGFSGFVSREEPTSYNNYSAGITLNHTVWDFGRTLGGYKAARELLAAAGADVATSRDQVLLNTIVAYYLGLATVDTVAVAEQTLRQMEQHLAVARAQAAAGVRQRIDVTRAEADLASAKLSLFAAKNAALIARVNLATVMGLERAPDFSLQRPTAASAGPDDSDMESLVVTALEQRPDFRSQQARARASGHLVTSARAAYYPALGFTAGTSWQGYHLESEALPYNWFAGLTLSWNALGPVTASAASREAQANARAALANLRSLELSIRAEVESTALALREARERLAPAAALVTSATETLRLAEGRYEAGAGSIIEVADAQALYTQARLGQIQSEYDVETARARLQRALGSFADADEARPRASGRQSTRQVRPRP